MSSPAPRHGPRPDQQQPVQPTQRRPEPTQRHPEPWQRPEAPQPPPVTPVRDGAGMTMLRVITYVLASLASLVFLGLVVYGYVALQDLQDRLASNPLFGGSGLSAPQEPTTGPPAICATVPDDPSCALY